MGRVEGDACVVFEVWRMRRWGLMRIERSFDLVGELVFWMLLVVMWLFLEIWPADLQLWCRWRKHKSISVCLGFQIVPD